MISESFSFISQLTSFLSNITTLLITYLPFLLKVLPERLTIGILVEQLSVDNKREQTIKELTKVLENNPKYIDFIVNILLNTNSETQRDGIYQAFDILGRSIRTQEVEVLGRVETIIDRNDRNIPLLIECSNILGNIRDIKSVEILEKFIDHGEWTLSFHAIKNLGKIGLEVPIDKLLLIPTNSHHQVLYAVAEAFGLIKSEKPLNYLYGLLMHNEASVRKAAAVAIGNIKENTGSAESLNHLYGIVNHEDDVNVIEAIAESMRIIDQTNGRNYLLNTSGILANMNKNDMARKFIFHYELLVNPPMRRYINE